MVVKRPRCIRPVFRVDGIVSMLTAKNRQRTVSTRVMETDKGEPDRGKGGGVIPCLLLEDR